MHVERKCFFIILKLAIHKISRLTKGHNEVKINDEFLVYRLLAPLLQSNVDVFFYHAHW